MGMGKNTWEPIQAEIDAEEDEAWDLNEAMDEEEK